MTKSLLISTAVVFVLLMGFGILVHGVLLSADYKELTAMYRSEEAQTAYLPYMLTAQSIAAFAISWLYSKTNFTGPLLERGAKYGLVLAALMILHKFLIYYAVQLTPASLAQKQLIFDSLAMIVIGMVVARLQPNRA